jgi:hypothetical protein
MELIGSGLGYHIDLRSGVAAVFGGEVVGLDANFLNGVGRREIDAGVARRVIEVAAVEGEEVHVGAATVDVHFRAAASVTHRLRSVDVQDAGKNTARLMIFRPLRGRSCTRWSSIKPVIVAEVVSTRGACEVTFTCVSTEPN